LTPVLLFLGGIALLVAAGDLLVAKAAHLARTYDVPKVVVGAIVIGFGTSLPELFVSVNAALKGSPGLALGNIIGSNIANVGLILGIGAFMATLHVQRSVIRADLPLGVLAALFLLLWAAPNAEISQLTGGILLAGFAFYLRVSLFATREHRAALDSEVLRTIPESDRRPGRDLIWILLGLGGITMGSELLVRGGVEIAKALGVDERIIGISLVAFGTSLPELAAMWAAARKGETDLAVGNIAGSNLFNLLFVLGTTALIKPIALPEITIVRDLPVLAVFSVLAFPLLSSERRLGKRQGALLLLCYTSYIALTWSKR
jgi:cation:H+ antiporter